VTRFSGSKRRPAKAGHYELSGDHSLRPAEGKRNPRIDTAFAGHELFNALTQGSLIMFHPSIHNRKRRQAAILMVVIVLLMLFLVIGIAFVLYAEAQSTAARIYREAYTATEYPAPEDLFGWALGEIIYDAPDDGAGQMSAIRGHGLARNMYGWNYTGNPGPSMQPALLSNGFSSNLTPFGGSGALHTGNGTRMNAFNADDATLINHQVYAANPPYTNDSALFTGNPTHNPERNLNNLFTGGANAPYTYPDLNSAFLAWAVYDPNSQQYTVQVPSYWRGLHTQFGNLDPNNPSWLSNDPRMKYRTLRPRPADLSAARHRPGRCA
jgi:hypothetical protein